MGVSCDTQSVRPLFTLSKDGNMLACAERGAELLHAEPKVECPLTEMLEAGAGADVEAALRDLRQCKVSQVEVTLELHDRSRCTVVLSKCEGSENVEAIEPATLKMRKNMIGVDSSSWVKGHGIDEFLTLESAEALQAAMEEVRKLARAGRTKQQVAPVMLELPMGEKGTEAERKVIHLAAEIKTHTQFDGRLAANVMLVIDLPPRTMWEASAHSHPCPGTFPLQARLVW